MCVMGHSCVSWVIHVSHESLICVMGWLRLVGSIKWQVSFAKEPYKSDDILQKRPIILWSLLIEATPYEELTSQTSVGISPKRALHFSQKRPTFLPKEAYISPKRGLHLSQKRPTFLPKEAYISPKRVLRLSQKSPTFLKRALHLSQKRPTLLPKEAYVSPKRALYLSQKRPTSLPCVIRSLLLRRQSNVLHFFRVKYFSREK